MINKHATRNCLSITQQMLLCFEEDSNNMIITMNVNKSKEGRKTMGYNLINIKTASTTSSFVTIFDVREITFYLMSRNTHYFNVSCICFIILTCFCIVIDIRLFFFLQEGKGDQLLEKLINIIGKRRTLTWSPNAKNLVKGNSVYFASYVVKGVESWNFRKPIN